MVKDNLMNDENQSGFLTQAESEYLSCFEIKKLKLSGLLQKDGEVWSQNIKAAKKKTVKNKSEIEKLLEK